MDIVGLTGIASEIGALGVSLIVIWALLTERLLPKGRLEDARHEHELDVARNDAMEARLDRLTDIHEQEVHLMSEALRERMQ